MNYDLFKEYFKFEAPTVLAKKKYETKDKKENTELVELAKVRWSNLKDEIEKCLKMKKITEKPDKILKIVKEILEFNKQKHQTRQILYSLYRSKKLTKQLYKSLIDII